MSPKMAECYTKVDQVRGLLQLAKHGVHYRLRSGVARRHGRWHIAQPSGGIPDTGLQQWMGMAHGEQAGRKLQRVTPEERARMAEGSTLAPVSTLERYAIKDEHTEEMHGAAGI